MGYVTEENSRNCCCFIVEKHADIKNVISPLFKTFCLHTSKKLDFEDFNKAVLIKDYIKKILSYAEKEKIISLKNGINCKRKIFTYQVTNYNKP